MAKNYRERGLSIRCQVAKPSEADPAKPLVDATGKPVLDYDGQFFMKVSGSDKDERKRLIPADYRAFFERDVKALKAALQADGITDEAILNQISVESVYEEYVAKYRRLSETHAPAGQPDQFTVVVPKGLCVNMTGGGGIGSVNGHSSFTPISPVSSALFQRLKMAAGAKPTTPTPPAKSRKADPVTA
jgi:hypothetical protein